MSADAGAGAKAVAQTYFEAWKARDFSRLRSILGPEVTFVGPMGKADGADACVEGIQGMTKIIDDLTVSHVFADGNDVITWFELKAKGVEAPIPVANWSHVENGKVTRIRVAFDPRPILEKGPAKPR